MVLFIPAPLKESSTIYDAFDGKTKEGSKKSNATEDKKKQDKKKQQPNKEKKKEKPLPLEDAVALVRRSSASPHPFDTFSCMQVYNDINYITQHYCSWFEVEQIFVHCYSDYTSLVNHS
jgi:hypothetical protein